ncbi:hypothetical protein [Paraburkholderia sp. J8-2]|uniref:hypothetical protein n=1 Tax=Paraburkholderia sp. J8-2 TaxID=2805440 RepID=UPI002AB655E7|nr:hypothetical protein [Paraburkholderia sp. J8-2]
MNNMVDLRKVWNIVSIALGFALPCLLGAYEASLRTMAGEPDLRFFPPSLASAGLALLLPCFPIDSRPEPGTTREALLAARLYNWNACVLVVAGAWFLLGALLWVVVLSFSIKGTYPTWWPEWSLGERLGPAGTQSVLYYVIAVVLVICKLAAA